MKLSGSHVELLLNVVGPIATYQLLTRNGVGPVPALAVAAVFPLIGIARGWIRARRPNALGLLSLLFICLGLVVAFATNNPLVLLLKPSVTNLAYGLLALSSLLWRRPLIFYVGRQFATGSDPDAMARYDDLWQLASFRASQRRATVVWACWGLIQAAVRTALALNLPIDAFLVVWPPIDALGTVALVAWTVNLSRRAATPPPKSLAIPASGTTPIVTLAPSGSAARQL